MPRSTSISVFILFISWTSIASAQSPDGDEGSLLEELIVTGTRIPRTSADLPTPTTVIDAEQLARSGAVNLGDVMNQYPALLDGVGSNSNNDNGTGGPGTAGLELLNLRGLGTNRTLVLVDGRRHVPGDAGTSAVDISMIPVSLIESIDVITGGASAIYGADAVTGVVNIKMKRNFDGLSVDVSGGISGESDGGREDVSITYGKNFAGGSGNFTVSATYSNEDEIPMTARTYTNRNLSFGDNPLNTGPADGIPDQVLVNDLRFTPVNSQGYLALVNNAATNSILPIEIVAFNLPLFPGDPIGLGFDPALGDGLAPGQNLFDAFTIDRGTGLVRAFDDGGNCSFIFCDGGDGLQTAETNTLSSPLERVVVNVSGNYEFENFSLYGNAKYGSVKSNASGQAAVFHDGNFGPYIPIARDNPFLPAAMAAEMDARSLTVAPLAVVGFGQRSNNERETMQITLGGAGEFANGIVYDTYMQYGRVTADLNDVDALTSRYYQALDVTSDANGNAVCRDPSDGCIPRNPFNFQASPESTAWSDARLLNRQELTQLLLGFSMNGEWFDTAAGSTKYAAGVEYRREESEFRPDPLTTARGPDGVGLGLVVGNTGLTPDTNTFDSVVVGEYSAGEVFGEFYVPLLAGKRFVESLEVELAARFADYDLVGETFTYKAGLNWSVNDVLRLRGTYSRAVRAPNINEVFAPETPGAQFVTDPCHIDDLALGPNPANRQANCAALGIPADFLSLAAGSTRTVTGRGNSSLDPEEADTYTLGLVFNVFTDLSVAIDYWDIRIEDAITEFAADDVLTGCVDGASLDPVFCNEIMRDAGNQITNINVRDINAAFFEASGVDVEAQYYYDLGHFGSLDFRAIASYVDKINQQPNAADSSTLTKSAGTSGNPRLRGVFDTIYNRGDLQVGWTMRYVGSSKISRSVQPEELPFNKVNSVLYHNLSGSYNVTDSLAIYGGILNVADEEPPNVPDLNSGGLLYDAVGRYYTLGLRFNLN